MTKFIVIKEIRAILLSPKYPIMFILSSLLILTSVFIGINEYQNAVKFYHEGMELTNHQISEQIKWGSVSNKIFRKPDPMQIFVSGITFDLGRSSQLNNSLIPRLQKSRYSLDLIFSIFRFIDLSTIVLIVLSLFAIVLTYDSVSNEKESGTLRLVFSCTITRTQFIIGKFLGNWIGLIISLLIPILISLILVLINKVPLNFEHWIKFVVLLGFIIFFVSFFIALGVLISTLTKKSSFSLLLCLSSWIFFLFIIPRVSILLANQIVSIPTNNEIESKKSIFTNQKMKEYTSGANERIQKFYLNWNPQDTSIQFRIRASEDSLFNEYMNTITTYNTDLVKSKQRTENSMYNLALTLSRISPVSTFQIAAMNLANTDVLLKDRYESSINQYRTIFWNFVESQQNDDVMQKDNEILLNLGNDVSMSILDPRLKNKLELKDFPEFDHTTRSFFSIIDKILLDFFLLICTSMILLITSWLSFMRYDLR